VLRRQASTSCPARRRESGTIPFGRTTLDLAARTLSFEGKSVDADERRVLAAARVRAASRASRSRARS
jgi:hypothetical protein